MIAKVKTYKTHGNWDAQVIWVSSLYHFCYAIHKPNTTQESIVIIHNKFTGKVEPLFIVGGYPAYPENKHSADIILDEE